MDTSDSYETRFQSVYSRAIELRSRGEYAKALKKFASAYKISSKLEQTDERIFEIILGIARCHLRLGNSIEAEENYQLALSVMEENSIYKNSSQIASVLWEIAVLYTEQRRFKEAALFFKNSIVITSKWSGPNDRFIADCLWGLSKCFCALGNFVAAEQAIRNALSIYTKAGFEATQEIVTNRKNLASLLIERGKYKEALKEVDKALKCQTTISEEEAKDFSRLYFKLSWCAQRQCDFIYADKALSRVFKLSKLIHGTKSPMTALTKIAIAHNKDLLADYGKEEKLLKEAIRTLIKSDALMFKLEIMAAKYELGQCYLSQKQTKKAISILEEVLIEHEEDPLINPELFASTLHTLAKCHELDCNLARARELNKRSIFVKEQIYGVMHEEVAQSLYQLSSCLIKLDDQLEANFAKTRAAEITDALFTSS